MAEAALAAAAASGAGTAAATLSSLATIGLVSIYGYLKSNEPGAPSAPAPAPPPAPTPTVATRTRSRTAAVPPPVPAAAPTPPPAPAPAPAVAEVPVVIPAPAPEPAPAPAPAPEPTPEPAPAPAPAPEPTPEPAPAPAPEPVPEPVSEPAPAPAPEPTPEAAAVPVRTPVQEVNGWQRYTASAAGMNCFYDSFLQIRYPAMSVEDRKGVAQKMRNEVATTMKASVVDTLQAIYRSNPTTAPIADTARDIVEEETRANQCTATETAAAIARVFGYHLLVMRAEELGRIHSDVFANAYENTDQLPVIFMAYHSYGHFEPVSYNNQFVFQPNEVPQDIVTQVQELRSRMTATPVPPIIPAPYTAPAPVEPNILPRGARNPYHVPNPAVDKRYKQWLNLRGEAPSKHGPPPPAEAPPLTLVLPAEPTNKVEYASARNEISKNMREQNLESILEGQFSTLPIWAQAMFKPRPDGTYVLMTTAELQEALKEIFKGEAEKRPSKRSVTARILSRLSRWRTARKPLEPRTTPVVREPAPLPQAAVPIELPEQGLTIASPIGRTPPAPEPAPAPVPEPVPEPAPAPEPVPEPAPAPAPEPVPEPAPAPEPAPTPEQEAQLQGLVREIQAEGTGLERPEVMTAERAEAIITDVFHNIPDLTVESGKSLILSNHRKLFSTLRRRGITRISQQEYSQLPAVQKASFKPVVGTNEYEFIPPDEYKTLIAEEIRRRAALKEVPTPKLPALTLPPLIAAPVTIPPPPPTTTIGGPLPIGREVGRPTQPGLVALREALRGPEISSTAGTVPAPVAAAPPAAPVRVPIPGVVRRTTGERLPAFATMGPTSPSGQFRSTVNPLFAQKHKSPAQIRFENLPDQLNQEDFNRLTPSDRMQYKIEAWAPGTGRTFKKRARRIDTSGGMRKKTFKSRRGKKTNGRGTRRRKDRANRSHKNARRGA